MDGCYCQPVEINIQPIADELITIAENQATIIENQSLIIDNFDNINQSLEYSNVGSMMIVLVLGILVGIGFTLILRGGKK